MIAPELKQDALGFRFNIGKFARARQPEFKQKGMRIVDAAETVP